MEKSPGSPEPQPGCESPANKATAKAAGLPARAALLFSSLSLSLAVVEVGLRLFPTEDLKEHYDEPSLSYRYDPLLGWSPVPNSAAVATASRRVTIHNNSFGFRGPEPTRDGKPCIIFLGDSFVWGFDVEASERFTEKLQALHPEWTILNLGVSGYGTDQEYLLLQKHFDDFHPRVVFLVICGDNDNEDNAWNCRGGYYKPYYTLAGGRLNLQGVPVPKSDRAFFAAHHLLGKSYLLRLLVLGYYRAISPARRKNPEPPTGALLLGMRNFVHSKGAFFAVGLQQSHPDLEKFLRYYRIPYVDLTTTNYPHRYPRFGSHWTPEGHAFVAGRIDEFLKKN